MALHYFDCAATTPVCPEAAQAVFQSLTGSFGSPFYESCMGEFSSACAKRGCKKTRKPEKPGQ